jgi:hypothetical protein
LGESILDGVKGARGGFERKMNETTATLEITRKPAAPSLRKRRETTAMLAGHRFHILTDEQLHFVLRDAREAADNTRGMDYAAECKYLDQTPGIVVKPR